MRLPFLSVLLAGTAAVASPVLAQDHTNHHAMDHSQDAKAEPDAQAAPDHTAHGATDHSQHGPAEKSQVDHATMDHSQMDHSSMDHGGHGSMTIPSGPPPARAFEGPEHAADQIFDPSSMAAARAYNHRMHGAMATGMVLGERLEART